MMEETFPGNIPIKIPVIVELQAALATPSKNLERDRNPDIQIVYDISITY